MPNKPSQARPFYHSLTDGIRVTVRPGFLAEQSRPELGHHVFAYHIRIENVGTRPAQLLTRHWLIHYDNGDEVTVEGAGVIGEHPLLGPGQVHEYQSHCVLPTARGWMQGRYGFVRPDGTTFEARIPRFVLEI